MRMEINPSVQVHEMHCSPCVVHYESSVRLLGEVCVLLCSRLCAAGLGHCHPHSLRGVRHCLCAALVFLLMLIETGDDGWNSWEATWRLCVVSSPSDAVVWYLSSSLSGWSPEVPICTHGCPPILIHDDHVFIVCGHENSRNDMRSVATESKKEWICGRIVPPWRDGRHGSHDLDIVLKQVEGCQSSLRKLALEPRRAGARRAIHGSTDVPTSFWGFKGRGGGAQDDTLRKPSAFYVSSTTYCNHVFLSSCIQCLSSFPVPAVQYQQGVHDIQLDSFSGHTVGTPMHAASTS